MAEPKLRINMLSGFSANYQRHTIDISRIGNKVLQVWCAMLYSGNEGVSRDELLVRLYGSDDIENANSLRALVFRLRNFLNEQGLDGAGSIKVRGGAYHWMGADPHIDAIRFDAAAKKALTLQGDRAEDYLLKATQIYSGRFLPQSRDPIFKAEADRLEEQYAACVRRLVPILQQKEHTAALLELATRASELLDEREEWTLLRLDCLIKLDRREEALDIYRSAVDRLAREDGVAPSDAMMSRYKEISSRLRFSLSDFASIQADLWERSTNTSYFCSYPGFVDCYRVASRSIARDKTCGELVLCTLTDVNDIPMQKGVRLDNTACALQYSIGHALRGSDVYTCCSPSQYLILLMNVSAEDTESICRRIRTSFESQDASWGCRIRFEQCPATPPAAE